MLLRAVLLPITATSRRDLVERFGQLIIGLLLYGVALGFMVRGGIGVAPWDVLSLGIARWAPIGYGTVTVAVSVIVLLLWIPLRQRVGLGTVLNALLVGPSADLALLVLPTPGTVWIGAPMFVVGLLLLAFATGLYISADFGPGPRDGLMTGLVRRTGWPVWLVRTLIEGSVLAVGWLLGGPVGVGTVLFAFGVGPLIGWFLPRIASMREARSQRLTAAPAG
ncbi:YczE/YyaS/YitT family protein [Microbacterium sp. 179-I 3D4 NHS]|uniref:membrane protein YczE n=1 Tax=Microbacterium sp. 179-I 3D4 NHS TaxID=3142381 RepID=UPI0039A120FC